MPPKQKYTQEFIIEDYRKRRRAYGARPCGKNRLFHSTDIFAVCGYGNAESRGLRKRDKNLR